jgi:hypothetical protein
LSDESQSFSGQIQDKRTRGNSQAKQVALLSQKKIVMASDGIVPTVGVVARG